MSITPMRSCWEPDFPAHAIPTANRQTVLVVALAIADTVNDRYGLEFWMSMASLGVKTGLHRNTVGPVVRHLVEVGVLAKVGGASGRTNRYIWTWPPPDDRRVTSPDPVPSHVDIESEPDDEPAQPTVQPPAPVPCSTCTESRAQPAQRAMHEPKRTQENPRGAARAARAASDELPMTDDLVLLEPPSGPTPAQRADRLQKQMWTSIEARTGKPFRAMRPIALKAVITPFLIDYSDNDVRRALRALYDRGAPITRSTMQAQLDGRRPARRGNDIDAALGALRFDAAGNVIVPC